jgi:hypothetical protein
MSGGGNGGKMTNFRSLDDIPDFTDDFGKHSNDFEESESPRGATDDPIAEYMPVQFNKVQSKVGGVSGYSKVTDKRTSTSAPPMTLAPPPLPAEEYNHHHHHASKGNSDAHSPLRKANAPAPSGFDTNSCDSVDTDLSDDDYEDDCNNAYYSSRDDYHVDYSSPSKINNKFTSKQNNVSLFSLNSNVVLMIMHCSNLHDFRLF